MHWLFYLVFYICETYIENTNQICYCFKQCTMEITTQQVLYLIHLLKCELLLHIFSFLYCFVIWSGEMLIELMKKYST